jgi:hypothetical protein
VRDEWESKEREKEDIMVMALAENQGQRDNNRRLSSLDTHREGTLSERGGNVPDVPSEDRLEDRAEALLARAKAKEEEEVRVCVCRVCQTLPSTRLSGLPARRCPRMKSSSRVECHARPTQAVWYASLVPGPSYGCTAARTLIVPHVAAFSRTVTETPLHTHTHTRWCVAVEAGTREGAIGAVGASATKCG